jgi:hypothetical protein
MKIKLFVIIAFSLQLLVACKNNDEEVKPTTSNTTLNQKADTSAVLVYSGSFSNGPYGTVSGKAEVYRNYDSTYVVQLKDFSSSNGPALHVMLSKEPMPVNFTDLGVLQSVSGNQLYKISGKPDFSMYKYISIHCVDYNHLFGYSLLDK